MGDQSADRDQIKVVAEGKELASGFFAKAGKFPYIEGEVMVSDTMLDITFSDEGGKDPNWAITRLTLQRVRDLPVEVDLAKTEYYYDMGPTGSPVQSGWDIITSTTNGDIKWSGGAVDSRDRDPVGKIGKIHRDFIHSDEPCTLHHKIANGRWQVTLNMGDPRFEHDLMGVRAEGQLISDAITSPAGQYSFVNEEGAQTTEASFEVEVTDGELTLEFFDNGGTDMNWALSRISLKRLVEPN